MNTLQNKKNYTSTLRGIGFFFVAITLFVAGAFSGTKETLAHILTPYQVVATPATLETEKKQDLTQFWYVWNLMQSKYPFAEKIPTDTNKMYGAIEGLVSSYKDPYTVFFSPQQAKLFSEQVKGSFGGVGIEVGIKNKMLTVIAPLKDSAAYKAGIKSGDIITEINKKKADGIDIDTAISMIRGDVGTVVNLGIARKGAGEVKYFEITREIVKIPVIDTVEKGDVFIINLYSFSENSADLFKEALKKFSSSGKQKLIVDLRDNPGGYLDAAVDIGSYFLPSGKTIVRESTGATNPESIHSSKGFSLLPVNPKMVILINGGSASASEILAGALSENNVAELVGTTSFGKGSVQQVMDLSDGSSLKITVAKWLTPQGVSISEKGITPDISVENTAILDKKTNKYSDPQLEAAIKLLDK